MRLGPRDMTCYRKAGYSSAKDGPSVLIAGIDGRTCIKLTDVLSADGRPT